MIRRRFVPVLLLALAGAALGATAGAKQEATPLDVRLLGVWESEEPDGGAEIIARAIESGTAAMGPMRRNVARRRLLANNPALLRLQILDDGGEVEVRFGSGHRYRAPLDGTRRPGRGPDGGGVSVAHRMSDGVLTEQVWAGGSGGSRMTFAPSEDGLRLVVTMRITSRHLPGDIVYRLQFRKRRS